MKNPDRITQAELQMARGLLQEYHRAVLSMRDRLANGATVDAGPLFLHDLPEISSLGSIRQAFRRKLIAIVYDGNWRNYLPLVFATIAAVFFKILHHSGVRTARARFVGYLIS